MGGTVMEYLKLTQLHLHIKFQSLMTATREIVNPVALSFARSTTRNVEV